jgi:hypothetical protein
MEGSLRAKLALHPTSWILSVQPGQDAISIDPRDLLRALVRDIGLRDAGKEVWRALP